MGLKVAAEVVVLVVVEEVAVLVVVEKVAVVRAAEDLAETVPKDLSQELKNFHQQCLEH